MGATGRGGQLKVVKGTGDVMEAMFNHGLPTFGLLYVGDKTNKHMNPYIVYATDI